MDKEKIIVDFNHYKELHSKLDTLNKCIDDLVDKYTKEINKCDCDTCRACQTYHKVIDDLTSFKGK